MKILKPILFIFFSVGSFFVLYKDTMDLFSFYSIVFFTLGLFGILILAFWNNRSSAFAIIGMFIGVVAYFGYQQYNEHQWQNQLEEVIMAIDQYQVENKKYPDQLSDLPIVLPNLSLKKHLRYRLDEVSGEFILEYTEGFSTVYNYKSETKTWENYVDWAGG